jgi:hypothetical protein
MSPSSTASSAADAVRVNGPLRSGVALVCALAAGVHLGLVPEHLEESVGLGSGFVVAAVLLAAAAAAVRRTEDPLTVSVVGLVLLLVAGAYLLSRTTGIPGLIARPESPDPLGIAVSLLEAAAALACLRLNPMRNLR